MMTLGKKKSVMPASVLGNHNFGSIEAGGDSSKSSIMIFLETLLMLMMMMTMRVIWQQ